ncbi:MAG: DJ-1/PfpI family protein [Pseudomonadota bacterium]
MPRYARLSNAHAAACLALTLALTAAATAHAHHDTDHTPAAQTASTSMLRSYPEAGTVLERPPRGIHLWFSETVGSDDTILTLEGPGGTALKIVGVHAMGEDDLMGMVEGDMPDGEYHLRWSHDDGAASGAVSFQVQRPAGFVEDRWEPPLDIGVVLYNGTEPLDVFGPVEMWMNAGLDLIRVHFIAQSKAPVALSTTSYPAAMSPHLVPQYTFEDAPALDVLMVPGGLGTLAEVDNPAIIDFIRERGQKATVTTSVCTGSALLAKAGLLKDEQATGNKVFFDYLTQQGEADWVREARWVESGRFFTSSGVSAGMDMSLAVVSRFFGLDAARMIAASTEYEWNEDPQRDPFVKYLNAAMPYIEMLEARAKAP